MSWRFRIQRSIAGGKGSFLIPPPRWRKQYSTAVSAGDLSFGQPLHETHPHLLAAGELTPGITSLEYYSRRQNLADLLPANSLAIIPASDLKYRSGSSAVFYDFHQDPDFLYLTGFNEPEALAVIEKRGSSPSDAIFHLFVRPKSKTEELWEGARSGVQAALDVFNADEAGDINRLEKELPKLLKGISKIYTDLPRSFAHKTAFSRYLSGSALRPSAGISKHISEFTVTPLRPLMNKLRVLKSAAEIALMRRIGKVSGRAITAAMKQTWTGEKQLDAFVDYEMKRNGMDGPAYVPVVAGGENALSIHYVRNDDVLSPEQMVLMDAGGQFGGYITDITRTWPVGGVFSDAQRDLYTAVLDAQRICVGLCTESKGMTLDSVHEVAERELKKNLEGIGFDLSGNALSTLFPHHVGHYIGLDVHDSPGFLRSEKLKEGFCITVEPGIYVPADSRWPKHFHGMGIRIEDSICVDAEGPLVLTTEAVKEVVDIEALRR